MACSLEDAVYITACFIPSSVTWCEVGSSCSLTGDSFNSDCAFTGVADQFLSKLVALTYNCFNLVKTCIPNEEVALDTGCDMIFGKNYNYGNMSDYWGFNTIYNTDTVSALYKSQVSYGPWDFLKPFNPSLWVLILIVLFIFTPLIMAIVEYDEGETVVGNFIKFLPDSIHAHTGIDLLNDDLPTKNTSYVLSVFVSIFSFVTLSLYASNLTAFVLYNNNSNSLIRVSPDMKIFVEESVYSTLPIDNAVSTNFIDIPTLHDSGYFDYIVAENYLLRNIKTCEESLKALAGIGISKYIFIARKFGEENILKIKENIRGIEFVFDYSGRETCDNNTKGVGLQSIYGLFLVFFIPAILIMCTVLIRHFFIKKKANPYITNSP